MKKITYFLLITIVSAFASCTTQYVQISQTTGVEKNGLTYNNDNKCYEYIDDACTIAYSMWSVGGRLVYTITNKTDRILYIDNNRSFLVKDGKSYVASSVTPKTDYIELGYIAPHATASIVGPNLNCPLFLDCDLSRTPEKNKPATMTFDSESTPFLFRSVLCYRLSESDKLHLVDNAFYVSRVTNYQYNDLSEQKTESKDNCLNVEGNNSHVNTQYKLNIFTPSNGFITASYSK